jgi:hypothetical protein
MFKAAYPWATAMEEQEERRHHKTLPTAGHEEVAGNVWISPDHGLCPTLLGQLHGKRD